MQKEILGKRYGEWKEIVLQKLDMHPMTFDQLAGTLDCGVRGPASQNPRYHTLLEIVSKMQTKGYGGKSSVIGTIFSEEGEYLLYRNDQQAELNLKPKINK